MRERERQTERENGVHYEGKVHIIKTFQTDRRKIGTNIYIKQNKHLNIS